MQITRHGAQRDHGDSKIGLGIEETFFTPEKTISLTAYYVPDFNTESQHNWRIEISLTELRGMIDAAASAVGGDASSDVAAALAPSLTSLLRLATECSKHKAGS